MIKFKHLTFSGALELHNSGSPAQMNVMRNTPRKRGRMMTLNPVLQTSQSLKNSDSDSHSNTSHPQHLADGSTSQRPKPKKGKTPRPRPTHCMLSKLVTMSLVDKSSLQSSQSHSYVRCPTPTSQLTILTEHQPEFSQPYICISKCTH